MKKTSLPLILCYFWVFGLVYASVAPSAPILYNPVDTSTPANFNTLVTLSWSPSLDSNGGTITYDLYLSTSNDPSLFREGLFEGWTGSGGTEFSGTNVSPLGTYFQFFSALQSLTPETTYYWKVVAENELGETAESTIFSFTTPRENTLPTAPGLLFPLDGAAPVPHRDITLEWAASIDADGDPVTYNVYFGDNEANPFAQPLVASGITETSFEIPGPLKDQQVYYWRVQAVDGYNGQTVPHGGTRSFWELTVENYVADAPNAGNLIAPIDGSANTSFEVTFQWQEATDKDNTPLVYDVYTDRNPDPQTPIATDLTGTSLTHSFTAYGQHYWKVVVKDGTGLSDDYPIFSFTTWDTAPNLDIEMVTVQGGRFMMGQSESSQFFLENAIDGSPIYYNASDENPAHELVLDNYQLSKYEITNQQYVSFLNAIIANTSIVNSVKAHNRFSFPYRNVSYNGNVLCQVFDATRTDRPVGYEEIYDSPIIWNGVSFELDPQFENHPVRFMYYQGARWFSKWLGDYRLPTEAEWEYAAMGGNQSQSYTYSGAENFQEVAVNNIGAPIDVVLYSSDVGTLLPNELGIYDMTGNVQEICEDFYAPNYYGTGPVNNPVNTVASGGLGRSVRGGNFTSRSEVYLRTKARWRLSGSQYINYSGIRLAASIPTTQSYGLNGTILDVEGNPLAGVRLNGFTDIVETDALGNYNTLESSDWSGTIVPELAGYTFTPENVVINNLQADTGMDFIGTPIVSDYILSGSVVDGNGNPLPNAVLNGFSGSIVTNVDGNFTTNESEGWSGTIVPELSGYTFEPENAIINNLQADHTGISFVGHPIISEYMISGSVVDGNGNPLANVLFKGFSGSIITNAGGSFTANQVEGWSGTIVPELSGYTFQPENVIINDLQGDMTSIDLVATPVITTYMVSGRIVDGNGSPIPGVKLNGLSESIETDEDGNFSSMAPKSWSGTIVPELPGYTFEPENLVINNLQGDMTSIDFVAIPVITTYIISGRIVDGNGSPIPGVKLNGLSESIETDEDGNFSSMAPKSWSGTMEPQFEGYTFNPKNRTIAYLEQDLVQNFTGMLEGVEVSKIVVYPNPSREGSFEIRIPEVHFIKKIRLFSVSGLVLEIDVNDTTDQFVLAHILQSGAYIVQVLTDTETYTSRILID